MGYRETGMSSAPISFSDPEIQRCPFAAYAEVRKAGPAAVEFELSAPDAGWARWPSACSTGTVPRGCDERRTARSRRTNLDG